MFSIKSTFSILLINLAFRLCLASRVTFDFPKCGNILLIHTGFHDVLRFGHDLGMSFLKQRFHGDLLASFDPGMS